MIAWNPTDFHRFIFYNPLILSLLSNDDLKSLLTSLSTRLTHRYLVTRLIQCSCYPDSRIITFFCDIAKPFVWYRNESAGSPSDERLGGEMRTEAESGQSDKG